MGNRIRNRTATTHWPLAYFIVTAINAGVLVAMWHWFRGPTTRYELVFVGLIVGMYATASVLHYYQVASTESPSAIAAREER